MSAESAFRENCGPDVEFVSTELRQGKIREFCFQVGERMKVVSTRMVNDAVDDDRMGAIAGQRAREWAQKQKEKSGV